MLSVVLSAMQVELAVQSTPTDAGPWNYFTQASRWFSVTVAILVALAIVIMAGIFLFLVLHGVWFSWRLIRKKGSGRVGSMSAVV